MTQSLSRTHLVFRYTAFALLAGLANLLSQRAVLSTTRNTEPAIVSSAIGTDYIMAVAVGTIIGLIVKYALDKRWVFFDLDRTLKGNSRKFMLYTVMGGFTTLIFWGSETFFWLVWQTDAMREVGMILGLAIGYICKYNLDRRYVFDVAAQLNENSDR